MTSPLPPKRRDSRNLADLIRQDRQNLRQLGVGFVGGRFPLARPLGATAQSGDNEDDVDLDDEIAFCNTDQTFAAANGSVTLALSYVPIDGSLHVRWNGLNQPPSEWTLNGNLLTLSGAHVKAGDVLGAAYAYYPNDVVEPDGSFTPLLASLRPLAWWKQGEAAGTTMADSSGNGHSATYNGQTLGQASLVPTEPDTTSTEWTFNDAVSVPADSWINIPTIALLAVFHQASPSTMSIMSRDTFPGSRLWNFRRTGTTNAEFVFWTSSGFHSLSTVGGTPDGSLLIATYDGSQAKIYVNGVLNNSLAATGSLATGTAPLRLGHVANGSFGALTDWWEGRLQHLAIFSSLSASDAAALAEAGGF